MGNKQPRYLALLQNLNDYRGILKEGNFSINENFLEKVVNTYWEKLDSWKNHFQIKDKLDRHKVGALTALYFMRFLPVKIDEPYNKIINEHCAIRIACSFLLNGEHVRPSKILNVSMIRMLSRIKNNTDTISNSINIIQFVEDFAMILFQLESEASIRKTTPV